MSTMYDEIHRQIGDVNVESMRDAQTIWAEGCIKAFRKFNDEGLAQSAQWIILELVRSNYQGQYDQAIALMKREMKDDH